MEGISYQLQPISTVESLCITLGTDLKFLTDLIATADNNYYPNKPTVKADGSTRVTYRLSDTLKKVHTTIKLKIFYNTYFPSYIQGSIKDPISPRSPHSDAQIHSQARFLICTKFNKTAIYKIQSQLCNCNYAIVRYDAFNLINTGIINE